jgi:hypothetical protein
MGPLAVLTQPLSADLLGWWHLQDLSTCEDSRQSNTGGCARVSEGLLCQPLCRYVSHMTDVPEVKYNIQGMLLALTGPL